LSYIILYTERISETSVTDLPTAYGDQTENLLKHYASKARAANTARTYHTQRQQFQEWCGKNGRSCLPATPETIAWYLAERAQAGAALSSIAVALAAIQFAHDRAGATLRREDPLLRLVLDGIRREHPRWSHWTGCGSATSADGFE
jgi:site-specific recombinase XerD